MSDVIMFYTICHYFLRFHYFLSFISLLFTLHFITFYQSKSNELNNDSLLFRAILA